METTTVRNHSTSDYVWSALRIALGWIFLWAFLDKTFGLGFATTSGNAWIRGGSPTFGFLTFGTKGPFAGIFQAIAGHPVADVLFMAGLLGVGVGLLLGVAVRVSGYSGALMLLLMWLAALPPENNPFLDDHLVYAIVLVGVAHVRAAVSVWSLAGRWRTIPLVAKHPNLA